MNADLSMVCEKLRWTEFMEKAVVLLLYKPWVLREEMWQLYQQQGHHYWWYSLIFSSFFILYLFVVWSLQVEKLFEFSCFKIQSADRQMNIMITIRLCILDGGALTTLTDI